MSEDADNPSMWWSQCLNRVDVCGAPRVMSP
uniref:Conserved hypothethical protein n=1 Tax=Ralstonia syzygii R24 TaxID=907261 RepID=G3ABB3_9RALS|nr:conserved hypothethical protein [Ralstonia syzygii R24]